MKRPSHPQIAINGAPLPRFQSIKGAYSMAVREGSTLNYSTFVCRIKAHPSIAWADLIKPPDSNKDRGAKRHARHQQQLDEAREICRKLDERRKLLTPDS